MYSPSDDSFLLSDCLKDYLKNKDKNISILDIGTGSGIQAKTCKKLGFNNITVADIDKTCLEQLKDKFKTIHTNLFSNIKEKFDLIIFNPPYLPSHKYDKEKDTTGGKKGYETIFKFLKQAKSHLNKNGEILLLFSSLSHPEKIKQKTGQLQYKTRLLKTKKLFFEELFVYLLQYN
jgi:release factor glutamine methyltransferase